MNTPQDKAMDEIFKINEAKKRPAYRLAFQLTSIIVEECGPELNALRIETYIQEELDKRASLVEALRAVVDVMRPQHNHLDEAELKLFKQCSAALAAVEGEG